MLNRLRGKLKNKSYRDAYVQAHLQQGLAYQICALRKQRGWSQKDLAEQLSLKNQSAVARMENPGYGKLSIATLLKLASVFDVALSVRFQSYSAFLDERRDLSQAALNVPSFEEEQIGDVWSKFTAGKGALWSAANNPWVSSPTVTRFPDRKIAGDNLALVS